MRISPVCKIVSAALMLATLPVAFAKPHGHASLHHGATTKLHKSVRTSTKMHESAGMPSERATEIQTALIKQGYLSGEPSGAWDSQTSAAMAKFQSDNGWQSKITPDSRGLIKLGLGPQAPPADEVVASSKTN
jgi:peptidoglycan hydrolase-like protein with peptidoglycan-binding domain